MNPLHRGVPVRVAKLSGAGPEPGRGVGEDAFERAADMIRWMFIISGFALAWLLAREWESRDIRYPPGILVPEAPRQSGTDSPAFTLDEYLLTPRASFSLRARVLSTEPYYLHRESDLSPLDLALGWGVMSDQAVLDRIEVSQSARWYRTRYQFPAPVTDRQIILHSSNMHMIPASRRVARQLKKLRRGDIVQLRGKLVDVDHDSGWVWRTSLSREDTGAGACEIFYVEGAEVQ
jgi:hypothetical protein